MASQSAARHPSHVTDEESSPTTEIWSPKRTALHTSLSQATLWRLREQGQFPDPIRLSPGRVGWRRVDVEHWLAARQSHRITDPVRPSPKRRRSDAA